MKEGNGMRSMEEGDLSVYESRFQRYGTPMSGVVEARIFYRIWKVCRVAYKHLDEYSSGCSWSQGALGVL